MVNTAFHTAPYSPSNTLSVYNLGVIALLAALAGLALAYGIEAISKQPRIAPASQFEAPFIHKNIAGKSLTIPEDWFSNPDQVTAGFADQVELALAVDFGGASPRHISLLMTPHSRAQSSAYLLDKVYLHQFLANQLSGPPGLIGKPLRALDGFQNETVWYDPLSPQPFVAKCQVAPVNGSPAMCMRTVRITDGLSVTYSFADVLLNAWPRFDESLRHYLEQIGALGPL